MIFAANTDSRKNPAMWMWFSTCCVLSRLEALCTCKRPAISIPDGGASVLVRGLCLPQLREVFGECHVKPCHISGEFLVLIASRLNEKR
jgi:hypothetical protein